MAGAERHAEPCDGVLTDRLLHVEVMLGHVDVRSRLATRRLAMKMMYTKNSGGVLKDFLLGFVLSVHFLPVYDSFLT